MREGNVFTGVCQSFCPQGRSGYPRFHILSAVGTSGPMSFMGWVSLDTRSLPLGWVFPRGGGYVQGVGMSKGVGTPPTDMRPVGEEWVPIGYHGIQSAYGRYLSYWNAFLLGDCFLGDTCIWRYYFAIIILLKLQISWHLWIPLFKKCNWSPSLPTNTASDFYFCNDSLGTGICMRIYDQPTTIKDHAVSRQNSLWELWITIPFTKYVTTDTHVSKLFKPLKTTARKWKQNLAF